MTEFEEEYVEYKSKSQVKRELNALKELGEDLVGLSRAELDRLPLTTTISTAIRDAQSMKKGALKRQLQYIGKLMRSEDIEAIQSTLDALRKPHKEDVAKFHQLESWRDALVAGDEAVLETIINQHPHIDRQHLRQLVRNAIREREQSKTPKAARQLFQYLKSISES